MAWLSGWNKRQKLTLTGGSSGAQVNYQLKLTVAYDSGMQSDFDDLRFTKADGTTLVDAWLETHTASTTATVWVEFPTTPANTVTEDYYMYYGNSGASSAWSGDNTFVFFDDFSGTPGDYPTGWTGSSSTYFKVSNTNPHSGLTCAELTSSSTRYDEYRNIGLGTGSYALGYFAYMQSTGDFHHRMIVRDDTVDNRMCYSSLRVATGDYMLKGGTEITRSYTASQWEKVELIPNYSTHQVSAWLNDVSVGTVDFTSTSGNLDRLWLIGDTADQGTGYIDDIYVRKYATNPATHGFGSVEWNSGAWPKRQKITLTGGTDGAQTDYQIKLTIPYDSDMKSDFSDLRFTTSAGDTLIDAWLETHVASTSATVWVEFPTTPANAATEDYYMYYGNSGVSSDWNMDNTFLFADDFPGSAIDTAKWTVRQGDVGVGSGYLTLTNTSGTRGLIDSKTAIPIGAAIHSRGKTNNNNVTGVRFNTFRGNNTWNDIAGTFFRYSTGKVAVQAYSSGTGTTVDFASVYTPTVWHTYKSTWKAGEVKSYIDDTLRGTVTSNVPVIDLYVSCYEGSAGYYTEVDWVFVTKFVTNPATYAFGSEGWDNTLWTKRKKLTLTGGASGAQTDYQIKLTIPYDSDMKSDFSDLRFTTSTGAVLIDAWLEDHTASTSATVWVEFPTTPANTITEDYYMYYGNSSGVSAWNGDNTFNFFDDFPGTSLNSQWDDTVGTPIVSGDNLALDGTDKVRASGFSISNCRCKFRMKKSSSSVGQCRAGMSKTAVASSFYADDCMFFYEYIDVNINGLVGEGGSDNRGDIGLNYVAGVWGNYEICRETSYVKLYVNDVLGENYTTHLPNESLTPRLEQGITGCTTSFDWYFVSKYATNPATYVFGSEETPGSTGSAIWYYRLLQVRRN